MIVEEMEYLHNNSWC